MFSRLAGVSLGALAALLCLCTVNGTAHAAVDPAKIAAKCEGAIIKAAAKFVQGEAKLLQKCGDLTVKGKPCAADQQAKIDKLKATLSTAISKGCGGKDKICSTVDPDSTQPPLADIGWGSTATCPDFEGKGCTNAIADCDGIATCLQCIGEKSVQQAIDLYYPPGRPSSVGNKTLNKCQAALGKAGFTFFTAKSKNLATCWGKKIKKPAEVTCPAAAQSKIDKARSKLVTSLGKPCLGQTNATIGLPANCLAVASCANTTDTLIDVGNCTACVTEFKVDCADRIAALSADATYPAECLIAPPTPTPTATPTVTPTETVTPTPQVTATPGVCGDNQIQAGEFCDGTATVGRTCGPDFACTNCNCACPSKVHFAGDATDPNSILDSGWTGISHRAPIISNGDVSIGLSCSATERPCGECAVTGLLPNANADAGEHNNRRCSQDSSIKCTDDTPCLAGGGTCKFYFGAPLPLAAGGVTSCVINQFATDVTGTANVETGEAATEAHLNSRVFLGFTVDNPCARCVGDTTINDGVAGGTCDNGPRVGLACDGNGLAPGRDDFGVTSLDCPMTGIGIAVLPIDLTNSTGTVTKTLSAANPKCTATGTTNQNCLCSTCNNAAQEPCSVNTDCPASGGSTGICGGTRCIGGTTPGAPCLTCIGGANHAAKCANVSECPGGTCQTLCGVCQGGIVPGTPCIAAAQCNPKTCVGGGNNGTSCTVNSECPGGTCPIPKICAGGTNAGAPCTVASECPGGGSCAQGNCSGSCNVPGQATAPSACDSDGDATLDCVDDSSGEGTCTLGPLDNNCSAASGHPQRGCLDDDDCGGGVSTCLGANRRCFLTGGFTGELGTNTLTAQGMADAPSGDVSNPTLGAVFCIGPTGLSSINNVAGLPGPGRVTIAGTAEGLP